MKEMFVNLIMKFLYDKVVDAIEKESESEFKYSETQEKKPLEAKEPVSDDGQYVFDEEYEEQLVNGELRKKDNSVKKTDDSVLFSRLRWNDGRGGLLMKTSDTRNGIVVLLPSFIKKADRVFLKGDKGEVDFYFAGWANPDADGELRAHYRIEEKPRKIGKRIGQNRRLVIEKGSNVKVLRVTKLNQRYD